MPESNREVVVEVEVWQRGRCILPDTEKLKRVRWADGIWREPKPGWDLARVLEWLIANRYEPYQVVRERTYGCGTGWIRRFYRTKGGERGRSLTVAPG